MSQETQNDTAQVLPGEPQGPGAVPLSAKEVVTGETTTVQKEVAKVFGPEDARTFGGGFVN